MSKGGQVTETIKQYTRRNKHTVGFSEEEYAEITAKAKKHGRILRMQILHDLRRK